MLNESIVEEAALEWFGEQARYASTLTPTLCHRPSPLRSGSHGERETVGHGPRLAPGEPAAERNRSAAEMDEVNSFGEVVLVGRLSEAIRRRNPAIPEEARATGKRYLQVRMERRQKP